MCSIPVSWVAFVFGADLVRRLLRLCTEAVGLGLRAVVTVTVGAGLSSGVVLADSSGRASIGVGEAAGGDIAKVAAAAGGGHRLATGLCMKY